MHGGPRDPGDGGTMTFTHEPTVAPARVTAPVDDDYAVIAPPSTARRNPARARRGTRSARLEELTGFGMLAPAVALLILFFVVPAGLAFGLAFTNARLISPYAPSF